MKDFLDVYAQQLITHNNQYKEMIYLLAKLIERKNVLND